MSSIDWEAVVVGAPLPRDEIRDIARHCGQAPAVIRTAFDGWQLLFRFGNGFGASVVSHSAIKARWEVAVLRLTGEGEDDWKVVSSKALSNRPVTDGPNFDTDGTRRCDSAVEVAGALAAIRSL